ncbi:hypothetical protein BDQ12DRAFT_726087 [Crucibulum laeve]|uniref:Uncharacterized protein n=1 Tax=Crucibulum laeve TaxID=68775 RepID=A0A5C3M2R9_9AGAR|nr:hypothetical protein BDQ12DRAFT_726087 [Crucibulum laeve]
MPQPFHVSLSGVRLSLTLLSVLFEPTYLPQVHTWTRQYRHPRRQVSVDVAYDVLYVLGLEIRLASASITKFLAPTMMAMLSTSTTGFSALWTPAITVLSSSLLATSLRSRSSRLQIVVNDPSFSSGLALSSISLRSISSSQIPTSNTISRSTFTPSTITQFSKAQPPRFYSRPAPTRP